MGLRWRWSRRGTCFRHVEPLEDVPRRAAPPEQLSSGCVRRSSEREDHAGTIGSRCCFGSADQTLVGASLHRRVFSYDRLGGVESVPAQRHFIAPVRCD